ncbi:hypothetical protein THASP1DRAFT_22834 [Thamnocephalis sphaerospora]|uniref:Chitin-binding type-4 domain-containing protein n=1 Tax=Thamnocephalis sphaerospora TaxID=78915 RepID=A0A4V1IWZ9_9FUNG|nr:hypothetical protein THASP1DRAFT_22834 [Thamnocephalis sphaerospora]|eukprot:RKP09319.1 hypothetical protein THASP1DRAFT_22834 [Thamnocephalis sphaerospora]
MFATITSSLTAIAVAAVLALAAIPAHAHSWLECTDFRDGQCHGWQRGWDELHQDLLMTHRIINQNNDPACFPGRQDQPNYAASFPMARAHPGQTLVFTYMERSHVVSGTPEPKPGNYSVHWSSPVDQDTIHTRSDLSSTNRLGNSIAFDDGGCSDLGTEPGRVKRPCWGRLTVPADAAPGRHQVVWWWKYALSNDYEEFTSCFDVQVLRDDEEPGNALPPNEAARWIGNTPRFNPGYGNVWYDYAKDYSYTDEFRQQVAAGTVAPQQRIN